MAPKKNTSSQSRDSERLPQENSLLDFDDFDNDSLDIQDMNDFINTLGGSSLSDLPGDEEPAAEAKKGPEEQNVKEVESTSSEPSSREPLEVFKPKIDDNIEDFFNQYEYSSERAVTDFVDEVSRAISGEEQLSAKLSELAADKGSDQQIPWQESEPEPDLIIESEKYLTGQVSLRRKIIANSVLSLLAVTVTAIACSGHALPFGLGRDPVLASGALLLFQLAVSALGLDSLERGFKNIFQAEPSVESLLAVSGLFSLIDGVYSLIEKSVDNGIVFSAVYCVAMCCCQISNYLYRRAMSDTMKAAGSSSSPIGMICDVDSIEGRSILKKQVRQTDGFYRSLTQEDYTETAYRHAFPIFLILSLALAALASIGREDLHIFPHILAGELAVAASFSSFLAYALPFRIVTGAARKAGAVIAGWGGALTVASADGAALTDEDIFPPGTVGIENVMIYGEDKMKAITYAASLIVASGSGLSRCFAELLRQQRFSLSRVYDFTFCESGGVKGKIRGESAMVGSSGFMNLMGIRVPGTDESSTSVYLAVGNRLYARYDITYVPSNTVQNALLSLLRTHTNVVFAMRDFNVTPASVRQRFKVPVDNLEHLSISACYTITENIINPTVDAAAILTREGAGPFASAIAGGKALRYVTAVSTIVSLLSSFIGMLLLFTLFWFSTPEAANATNVLIYLFINALVTVILSLFTRNG